MDNPFACLLALASFVCFILELALLCFSQLCCSGFADWMHAADHHTLSRQLKETIQCQSNPLRIHFSLPLFFFVATFFISFATVTYFFLYLCGSFFIQFVMKWLIDRCYVLDHKSGRNVTLKVINVFIILLLVRHISAIFFLIIFIGYFFIACCLFVFVGVFKEGWMSIHVGI